MVNKNSSAYLVLKYIFQTMLKSDRENHNGKVQQKLNAEQKVPNKLINHTPH